MSKFLEFFQSRRTAIISNMLDNPAEVGIYKTGECYEALDVAFEEFAKEESIYLAAEFIKANILSIPGSTINPFLDAEILRNTIKTYYEIREEEIKKIRKIGIEENKESEKKPSASKEILNFPSKEMRVQHSLSSLTLEELKIMFDFCNMRKNEAIWLIRRNIIREVIEDKIHYKFGV